jgi:formylglycine-generating enzyme required for sulfatase activity
MKIAMNIALLILVSLPLTGAWAATKAEAGKVAAKKAGRDCAECIEMVVIPAGSFEMGANDGDDNEKPVHRVRFAKPFAIGKTEVTQKQWQALMGSNPSRFYNCGSDCPVEQVSWNDAQAYISKLNARTGKHYRLPSEAEWEYAARAGSIAAYPWGNKASHDYANYGDDECCLGLVQGRDKWLNTAPVASFPANSFGLYDMIGNVWEWVDDGFHESYAGAPADGSSWPGNGSNHVVRGGSWNFDPQFIRASTRSRFDPSMRMSSIGFRLASDLR